MSKTTAGWSEEMHISVLTPDLARKVSAIMCELRGAGFKPRIYESMRTVAEQREMVRRGVSRTMRSKHVGSPGRVRAVDIADEKRGWGAPKEFWLTVGRCALLHGCNWGGLWGLSRPRRTQLKTFLTAKHDYWGAAVDEWTGGIGWDPAHVEL